jgi:hypothetical protein
MAKRLTPKLPITPPEEPKIVRANVARFVVQAPQFASLYTNDTQVQVSPWDIRLVFGMISEPATVEKPTVTVHTVGEVRMSPQHAKVVAAILVQQIKLYEESIGPIPLPSEEGALG